MAETGQIPLLGLGHCFAVENKLQDLEHLFRVGGIEYIEKFAFERVRAIGLLPAPNLIVAVCLCR